MRTGGSTPPRLHHFECLMDLEIDLGNMGNHTSRVVDISKHTTAEEVRHPRLYKSSRF